MYDGPLCSHCGSGDLRHAVSKILHAKGSNRHTSTKLVNICQECGAETEYQPFPKDIEREAIRQRRRCTGGGAENRYAGNGTAITMEQIEIIRNMKGQTGVAVVQRLNISLSTVHNIRKKLAAGFYDREPDELEFRSPTVYCKKCKFNVIAPCLLCKLKATANSEVRTTLEFRNTPIPDSASPKERELLEMSIMSLGIQVRVANVLTRIGIGTVCDLLHASRAELLSLPNFGPESLNSVLHCLGRLGFRIKSGIKTNDYYAKIKRSLRIEGKKRRSQQVDEGTKDAA